MLRRNPPPSFSDVWREELELLGVRARAFTFPGGLVDRTRAVVCIHGMGANGRSFMRQRPLANERFFLLLNLPYETPPGRDPVEFCAEAVEEFILNEGLIKPVIMGSSFGGAVSTLVALRKRTPLSGLVLAAAVLSRKQIPLAFPGFIDFLEAPDPIARLVAPVAAQIMGGLALDRDARDELVREARHVAGDELKRRLNTLFHTDLLGRVGEIDVPLQVIHGSRDWLVPWRRGRRIAEARPDAGWTLIKGAGHLPYMSHPEPFNTALKHFFDRIGFSAGRATYAPAEHLPSEGFSG